MAGPSWLTYTLVTLGLCALVTAGKKKNYNITDDMPADLKLVSTFNISEISSGPSYTVDKLISPWSGWSTCVNRCRQTRVRKCRKRSVCKRKRFKERRLCEASAGRRCRNKKLRRGTQGLDRYIQKFVSDLLFYEWSRWSACLRSCKQRRFRMCSSRRWCRNTALMEEKSCYIEGTNCTPTPTTPIPPTKPMTTPELALRAAPTAAIITNNTRLYGDTCGVKNVGGTLRIVGGRQARRGSWPFVVAILNRWREQYCGGVLISPQHVLTAAHCVQKNGRKRTLRVRIGEHDLLSPEGSETDYSVSKYYVHYNYNLDTVDSDIAVLKLVTPVRTGPYVNYACLPNHNESLPPKTMCYIMGWGKTKESRFQGASTLRQAAVPLVSDGNCQSAFQYDITETQMCAGYKRGGVDACAGDSGGPLMCRVQTVGDTPRWIVYGVTSFGEGCGDKGKYGIYTKVAKFSDWIKQKLAGD